MNEADLKAKFSELGADWELSKSILDRLNSGQLMPPPVQVAEFPPLDGRQILDLRGDGPWAVPRASAEKALKEFFPGEKLGHLLGGSGEDAVVDASALQTLGLKLSQYTAFGVLNGGMATSYADTKKTSRWVQSCLPSTRLTSKRWPWWLRVFPRESLLLFSSRMERPARAISSSSSARCVSSTWRRAPRDTKDRGFSCSK